MNVNSIKSNIFTAFTGGAQGVNPAQKPIEPVRSLSGGSNPFVPTDDKNQKGVGLVNSNLNNFSYAHNGKIGICNTIGIA